MKHLLRPLVILFAITPIVHAQTEQHGVTGTWRVDGVGQFQVGPTFPWEVVLKAEGAQLTGMVNSCVSLGRNAPIHDGHVEANLVRFKCTSGDGARTITFTGTLDGDEIAFTQELQVKDGGNPPTPQQALLFGPQAPPRFVARRVPDGQLANAFLEFENAVPGVDLAVAMNLVNEGVKGQANLFIPRGARRVRAVIVTISYGLGVAMYTHPELRKLAESTSTALLAPSITRIDTVSRAPLPLESSTDLLVKLIEKLAEESGHSELKDAPLLLWGHSAAGGENLRFASAHPERTLAIINYHSGAGSQDPSILRYIPALFFAAENDAAVQMESVVNSWQRGRAVGAPWALVVEPNATHGYGDHVDKAFTLLVPWITAILDRRLSADGKSLRDLSNTSAWFGNNRSKEIASGESAATLRSDDSWLPSEASARAWQVITTVGSKK
jgi:pimeloyl-ACP methyl ester carboxylesterase